MTAATEIQPRSYTPASRPTAHVSQATAIEQQRAIAEVQAAVVVAQSCPRDLTEAEAEMAYVCGRLDMAEQAFYQVDNRGTGPSVHLMRELARIWGNVDYGVKELHRDDDKGESEVQAFAWDIQKNTRSSRTFINPHARMKGRGADRQRVQLVDLTDIYLSNQNVGARAVRECISTILPRWFTEKAQTICRATLENGEGEPLQDRITKLIAWFGEMGVSLSQLEARVGKQRGQWTPGDVAQFKIAGKSIMAGEARKDDLFPPEADAGSSTVDEIAAAPEPKPEKRAAERKPKVKAAEPEPNEQQSADPEPAADPEEAAQEPVPGALSDTTPGQTDRVAKALGTARKGGMSAVTRSALEDDITDRLNSAGCNSATDRTTVIANILGLKDEFTIAALEGADLTKVRDTLHAWQQVGTTEQMVGRILDAADLNAEQQGEA